MPTLNLKWLIKWTVTGGTYFLVEKILESVKHGARRSGEIAPSFQWALISVTEWDEGKYNHRMISREGVITNNFVIWLKMGVSFSLDLFDRLSFNKIKLWLNRYDQACVYIWF